MFKWLSWHKISITSCQMGEPLLSKHTKWRSNQREEDNLTIKHGKCRRSDPRSPLNPRWSQTADPFQKVQPPKSTSSTGKCYLNHTHWSKSSRKGRSPKLQETSTTGNAGTDAKPQNAARICQQVHLIRRLPTGIVTERSVLGERRAPVTTTTRSPPPCRDQIRAM